MEEQSEKEGPRLEEPPQPYAMPCPKEKAYEIEGPIDLSQKDARSEVNILSKDSEFLARSRQAEIGTRPAVTSAMPVPTYLLASITNAGMQYDKTNADLAGSHMLQAYLTAKALHDVKMKQQQHHKLRFAETAEETENVRQFDKVSQLHQNFCRIYEKTVENDSVNLKRFREDRIAPTSDVPKRSFEVPDKSAENSWKVSIGDLNVNKLVEINKLEEEKPEKADGEEKAEVKQNENVSVTVETSSGKMILVSFHPTADGERLNSPPTGLLTKSADSKLKAEFFPPSSGPSPSYVG